MPRRAGMAFAGAAGGVALMVVTWFAVHDVAFLRQADANILSGFLGLRRPGLHSLTLGIASLCDPVPFVILAAVPVCIALLRGRPRVAIALVVLIVGANETTEILKPLLSGARDPISAPGVYLSHATWPSGHATAAMSLALAMVIAVPARLRPVVGALMAAFAVAVVYSFLVLGWHYPSDVLGGFEVATTWALFVLGVLWTYEARRPSGVRAAPGPRFSLGEALAPPLVLVLCGLALAAALTLARPHAVIDYARGHETFVLGAAAIAVLSFACASGLNLMLRRPPERVPARPPHPAQR
jgi:membrane-associated phospholipid phosphatase